MEEESEKRKIEVRPPLQMETGVATAEVSNSAVVSDTDVERNEQTIVDVPKNETTGEKMPKVTAGGSAINITISNGEIRSVIAPVVCTQPSTTSCPQMGRAIAPKPVAVTTKAAPILEAIGTALSKSLEQNTDLRSAPPTLLFTSNPSSQSQVIGTTSATNANTVKLANKTIPMALVPTSDGSQMIAVPLSGLNAARGKAQLITIPVQLSGSGATQIMNKGKPTIASTPMKAKMVINPSKIATSVSSTVASTVMATVIPTTTVSTISVGKMHTQVSTSITESLDDTKVKPSNDASTISKNATGVTIASGDSSPASNITSTTDGNTDVLSTNTSLTSVSPAFTPVAISETKNSLTMPPKVTVTISSGAAQTNDTDSPDGTVQSSSTATSVTVTMGSPPVTSASTVTLSSQPATDGTTNDSQKTDLVTTGDFDPVNIMEWKDGIGTLPGSHLKFKINEFGTLEMVDDDEAEEVMKRHSLKNNEEKMRRSVTITASPTSPGSGTTNPTIQVFDPDEIRTCANCGIKDVRSNFIRQGKFCSQTCATIQSTRLRNISKHSSITVKETTSNHTERKPLKTKGETTITVGRPPKTRKLSTEKDNEYSPNNSRPSTPSSLQSSSAVNQSSVTIKSNQDEPVAWEKRLRHFKTTSVTSETTIASNIARKKALKSKSDTFGVQNNAQRQLKVRKLSTEKVEKERDENSPENSRPSSPASGNHLAALHQSIFALRVSQQQQDAPVAWGKHSKNLLPLCDKIKPCEVFSWNPEKVASFVSSIPGCGEFGQAFLDELVDGEAFLLLNQPDLVKILGIKLGPAVKIYNSILVIRDNMNLEDA